MTMGGTSIVTYRADVNLDTRELGHLEKALAVDAPDEDEDVRSSAPLR